MKSVLRELFRVSCAEPSGYVRKLLSSRYAWSLCSTTGSRETSRSDSFKQKLSVHI